jgi:hypothetical protein
MPENGITLYAQWAIIKYTITWVTNGGVAVSPTVVNSGASTTMPKTALSNKFFAGWWTTSNGGTQWTSSTIVTANTTLYAHWSDEPFLANNSGGQITYANDSGTWYEVHTFTATGTLGISLVPPTDSAQVVVVAGGGGGGGSAGNAWSAGGGGAGEVLYQNVYTLAKGNYAITIGAGGAKGGWLLDGTTGGDTTVKFNNNVLFNAKGGGGGALHANGYYRAGKSGGSSGGGGAGGSSARVTGTFPSGTVSFGNIGGGGWNFNSGGGGGAGSVGKNPPENSGTSAILPEKGGAGGDAVLLYGVYYGKGGDGGHAGVTAGAANTGNGGGGGGNNASSLDGFNGGSGVVVVRFPYAD